MTLFNSNSLKWQILIWTGCVVTAAFLTVNIITFSNFNENLKESEYHDLATRSKGYVYTVRTILKAKADALLSLRDDLELYDTRGQMWVHIAYHAGEKIFDDKENASVYTDAFNKKLQAYRQSNELSDDKITLQIKKMLDDIGTRKNKFGDGMKFFYIGIPTTNEDKVLQSYHQYQDSSLWVPDPRVNKPYNPFIRPWYIAGQQAGRDNVLYTEPYAEKRTGEAIIAAATSISVDGVSGTLSAAISIKPIMEALLKIFREDAQMTIFSQGTKTQTEFVATEPKYVYSSRDASLGGQFKAYNDPEVIRTQSNLDLMMLYDETIGRDSGVLEWNIDGKQRLVAYDTIEDVGWKIFTSVSKAEVFLSADQVRLQNNLISLCGLVLLLIILWIIVRRAFRPVRVMAKELHQLAETVDLSKRTSVLSNNEIGQMALAINEVLDNVAAPVKELDKRVEKIAQGDLSVDTVIEAKGDVGNLINSFNRMTRQLIQFHQSMRDASPLTGLPGGVTIEKVVQKRIEKQVPFAFCMFDLDNFKPFNDRYGYSRGNKVIKMTADIIVEVVNSHGSKDDFIGHVGGDDFVLVSAPETFEEICAKIVQKFDDEIVKQYDLSDRQAGKIVSKNRKGYAKTFPIMSISVCAVSAKNNEFKDYIHVGEVIAELKAYAKSLEGSNFVVEQREAS